MSADGKVFQNRLKLKLFCQVSIFNNICRFVNTDSGHIHYQIVVGGIGNIFMKIFCYKSAAVVVSFHNVALRFFMAAGTFFDYILNPLLERSDNSHPECLILRQYELGAPSQNDCIAVFAACPDDFNQILEINIR